MIHPREISRGRAEKNETPNGTGSSSALHSTELDSRGGAPQAHEDPTHEAVFAPIGDGAEGSSVGDAEWRPSSLVVGNQLQSAAPVGDLSHSIAEASLAESATQPIVARLGDTVDALAQDVTTAAPFEGATQPFLSTVGNTADTLAQDVTTAAPLEAATQPVDTVTRDAYVATPDFGASESLSTMFSGESLVDVSHEAETLMALASATEAPVQEPSIMAAAADTALPILPIDVAGDVIALNDAPTPPANALFAGTQYTQYGITLSSDDAASAQHALSPATAASAQHFSAPALADVQQHAPLPPDIVDPNHSTDHIAHAIL
jgi:hypothetical protein